MKKVILLFTILIVLGSCNSNITPDGAIIEEDRTISRFITLEVSSGIEIEFSQSDEEFVKIETYKDVMPYVIVSNIGTTLRIALDEDSPFDNVPTLTVKISSPQLAIIKATDASRVKILTDFAFDYLEIHLSDESVFSMEEGKTLTTGSLLTNLDNGSKCTIAGTSERLVAESISLGSLFYGFELNTENVEAKLSIKSQMEISVSKSYKFTATGGSSIRYKGDAKGTTTATDGSTIESL